MQRISNEWNDYECIDAGNGEKLERWGNIILRRPDPQAIWNVDKINWKYDAFYHRSNKGGGYWEYKNKLPQEWTISYKKLTFKVSPTNFKHTGIFEEFSNRVICWILAYINCRKSAGTSGSESE